MTNSGRQLASIDFPMEGMERKYAPSDIVEIGFTDRTALVVILKDSLCLTFDMTGEPLLPPFHILNRGDNQGMELFQASVFDGGAVSVIVWGSGVVSLASVFTPHRFRFLAYQCRAGCFVNLQAHGARRVPG